ncbi:hypothetical protein ZTR_09169 [Talaromyces verruculosus]|nr:hypothetical protein ZTR_09169 [Talaromyces verruculosus]
MATPCPDGAMAAEAGDQSGSSFQPEWAAALAELAAMKERYTALEKEKQETEELESIPKTSSTSLVKIPDPELFSGKKEDLEGFLIKLSIKF